MSSVLLVDDYDKIREMLRLHLELAGHEVDEAENGALALEAIEAAVPDVVILDVMMPVMVETCRRIRNSGRYAALYVIMLTAKSETSDKVNGLDVGADAYLTKPVAPEELLAHVRVGVRTVKDRRLALYDPLTELFNRRAFDTMLEREIAEWSRYQRPLSLVMLDLDHFKKVNDTHGHDAGDAVLKDLAALLRDSCRPSDVACRWGGEEFVWLMPETDLADAQLAAERLRAAIESHAFQGAGRMTASFGVTSAIEDDTAQPLIKRADEALYAAKEGGRNRVATKA